MCAQVGKHLAERNNVLVNNNVSSLAGGDLKKLHDRFPPLFSSKMDFEKGYKTAGRFITFLFFHRST